MSSVGVTAGFAVLKNRDFSLYLGSRSLAAVATQMIVMAVGWQVYHLTGRLMDLGLIGLSQFLPFLCLVLFSGHAADQFDRRLIIILCQAAFGLCALLLLAFAWGNLSRPAPIFVVLGILGVARAFQVPATQSFLPTIVPTSLLGNAVAVNSSAMQVAKIAGPSIGGVLYALAESLLGSHPERAVSSHSGVVAGGDTGAAVVYGVSAAALAVSIVMAAMIHKRRAASPRSALTWTSLLGGLHFVWHRKPVLGAISLDLFAVLFGGASALLPAYTQDVLHGGPDAFGYLRAAPGVGAGVMALWLAFRPVARRVGATMFTGVAVFGAATLVLGLTTQFWVAMVALVILGAADMISVFIRTLLVQLETPDEIRGRVSAVNSVFIGASNELGEFESGTTAAWFGLVPAIALGGVATLVVAVVWARVLFPMLWNLQTFDQLKEQRTNGT